MFESSQATLSGFEAGKASERRRSERGKTLSLTLTLT